MVVSCAQGAERRHGQLAGFPSRARTAPGELVSFHVMLHRVQLATCRDTARRVNWPVPARGHKGPPPPAPPFRPDRSAATVPYVSEFPHPASPPRPAHPAEVPPHRQLGISPARASPVRTLGGFRRRPPTRHPGRWAHAGSPRPGCPLLPRGMLDAPTA